MHLLVFSVAPLFKVCFDSDIYLCIWSSFFFSFFLRDNIASRLQLNTLVITESSELSDLDVEAAQNDGRLARRPLKNRSREIQAHQILLSWMTELINEYNTSIKVHLMTFTSSISQLHQVLILD